jgi:hypothetical protein
MGSVERRVLDSARMIRRLALTLARHLDPRLRGKGPAWLCSIERRLAAALRSLWA